MPRPKGGRGITAPYDTKLMRVPVPLADQVSQLVDRYQDYVAGGGQSFNPPPLLDSLPLDKPVNGFELEEQVKHLTQERDQMDKELNELHQKNGDLNLQLEELRSQLAEAQAKPVNNLPDLEAARDRFLTGLKLGKQAPEYKRTKAILDRFIETC